jgi:para-nitrobenzyl esterase
MTDLTATRRLMLAAGLGAGAAALSSGLARAQYIASDVTRVVKTTNGPVVGLVENGVQTFKGLRYGAPPMGALALGATGQAEALAEPALAAQFGPAAIQLSSGGSAVRYPGTVGAALNQLMTSGEDITRQSEDCLFLNLWTPALDTKARPGDGLVPRRRLQLRLGNWPVYNGHNLAKNHDVVLVSVTHRLNAFGYLHLADLGGDRRRATPGCWT